MKRLVSPVPEIGTSDATWLNDMREHFAQTGQYRSNDVRRVLGNPWDRVELATDRDAQLMSRVAHA